MGAASFTLLSRHSMGAPLRRMEDHIRTLCTRLLSTTDDQEVMPILVELQDALRQHIECLRGSIANYPFVIERRVSEIPPTEPTPEDATNVHVGKA